MTKAQDWIKVEILIRKTSHREAPDIMMELSNHLRSLGYTNHSVEWFWGSMPGEKRPPATTRRSDKSAAAR